MQRNWKGWGTTRQNVVLRRWHGGVWKEIHLETWTICLKIIAWCACPPQSVHMFCSKHLLHMSFFYYPLKLICMGSALLVSALWDNCSIRQL